MNSLSLIKNYESSDSEEDADETPKLKLPLPDLPSFGFSKAITREQIDDASKHQNRTRNFAHEPGNWATYVFIPVKEAPELSDYLEELSTALSEYNFKLNKEFHVSLTRTVVFRHHWISEFIKAAHNSLEIVNPFLITFSGLKVYVNETKTRTFIGLQVEQGFSDLCFITKELDHCLEQYKLPSFYSDPSYHFSVLWTCDDISVDKINQALDDLPQNLKSFTYTMKVNHCECNCGNKNFVLPFRKI